ncbi:MAG TPA: DinB family protein [Candidatus Dormibacteraeota bacterium]|nr:DinB family protein [Candidatus Dormibacteraeota bacterium]
MSRNAPNIAPFYGGWQFVQERLVQRIAALSLEQLQLRPSPDLWPIWAITAHTAGARVYWLCHIFKEPGAERNRFVSPTGEGWEDDPTHPRRASELVSALESSWSVIQDCLDRWTPEMLQEKFPRESRGAIQIHTRQAVLMRLITHDAYHSGEISATLGMNRLDELDIWPT